MEMIIDFRKNISPIPPINIDGDVSGTKSCKLAGKNLAAFCPITSQLNLDNTISNSSMYSENLFLSTWKITYVVHQNTVALSFVVPAIPVF